MKYLKDVWCHIKEEFPTTSYYEIDEDRRAVRLIEFFINGSIKCKSRTNKEDAYMAHLPFPSIEEMNKNSTATDYIVYVSQEEFESLWDKYAH